MARSKAQLVGAAGALALVGAVVYVLASAASVGPPQCTPGVDCPDLVAFAAGFAFFLLLVGLPGFAGTALLGWKPRLGGALALLGGALLLVPVGLMGFYILLPAAALWLLAGALGLGKGQAQPAKAI